ncbi:hypothetical protein LguiB_013755 [Lonicera macranthoides]
MGQSPHHDDWADLDWYGEDGEDRGRAMVNRDVTRAALVPAVSWLLMELVLHEIRRRSLDWWRLGPTSLSKPESEASFPNYFLPLPVGDNFKEENFIGPTTYAKVYQGKLMLNSIGAKIRVVIVKIWDDKIGAIDDGKLVEAYNPILINFGLLNGGIMGGPRFSQQFGHMSLGYCDPYYAERAKRIDLKKDVVKLKYKTLDEWAYEVYKPQCSLVQTSLMDDMDYNVADGIGLTELAMHCIQKDNAQGKEVKFLPRMKYDPNLAKSTGFCSNGYYSGGPVNCVVYDLNPLDTLSNHTSKGISVLLLMVLIENSYVEDKDYC